MEKYSSLVLWRDPKTTFNDIFKKFSKLVLEGVSEEEIYKRLNLKREYFGEMKFTVIDDRVLFTFIPPDEYRKRNYQITCENDIPVGWLLCYTFQDFEITGDDKSAKFTAITTVAKAKEHLRSLTFREHFGEKVEKVEDHVRNVYKLLDTGQDDDMIVLSSNTMYSDKGIQFLKEQINNKVVHIKSFITVPYWKKG